MRERIIAALAEHDPSWSEYDDAKKAEAARAHEGDCWNHLRCIWFGGGAKGMATFLKDSLADDLSNFSAYDRVSTDVTNLIRAIYKEFHHGGDYAKGKGNKEYHAWLEKNEPKVFYMPESRASGGRQDLEFEASVAIYVNRRCYLKFLHELMQDPQHQNTLEDYLFVVLTSTDMIAALRAHAALYLGFVTELRFLAGSSHTLDDWSPFSMARVLDIFEAWMVKGAADGQSILDLLASDASAFSEIEAEQPAFAEYRRLQATKQQLSLIHI